MISLSVGDGSINFSIMLTEKIKKLMLKFQECNQKLDKE